MVKFFDRGKKKKPQSKEKPIDQAMLDLMAKIKAQGGVVVNGTTGQELSDDDIKREQRAREFEKIGDAHYARNEYLQAIEAYKKALEIYPDEVLYMNIGNAYCSMGEFETGIPYLEKSLEINPHYERAKKNLETAKAYRDYSRRNH